MAIDHIHHFEAQDDYVAIHAEQGKFLKQIRMKHLEENLPSNEFVGILS